MLTRRPLWEPYGIWCFNPKVVIYVFSPCRIWQFQLVELGLTSWIHWGLKRLIRDHTDHEEMPTSKRKCAQVTDSTCQRRKFGAGARATTERITPGNRRRGCSDAHHIRICWTRALPLSENVFLLGIGVSNHLLASRCLWRSKDYEALTGKEFQSPEMLWHKSDLPSVEANSFQCRTVCAWHAPISQQWNPGQTNSFSLVPSAYPKTDWIFLRFKACTLLWVSMSSAGQESVHWFQWSKKAIWCSIIYLETLERLLPTNAFHNH